MIDLLEFASNSLISGEKGNCNNFLSQDACRTVCPGMVEIPVFIKFISQKYLKFEVLNFVIILRFFQFKNQSIIYFANCKFLIFAWVSSPDFQFSTFGPKKFILTG